MKNKGFCATAIVLVLIAWVSVSNAQSHGDDIYWHIDPGVKSCSMVIDTALTQDQWHRFTRQVGAIATFKSLASAKTLGKMKFSFAIDQGYTPVDQRDPAWINTFTHPDEDCPLGDVISYPTLRARMGVTDNIDIGGYWTTAPRANYGMVGGEFKYAFLRESRNRPAAAVRASATVLTGVPDFDLDIFSVEVMASKKVAMFNPYVGVRDVAVLATETTSKVDLKREAVSLIQGYAGVIYSLWALNIAAEYNVSTVNTFALAIGFNL